MIAFLKRYEWLGTLGMARRRFGLRVGDDLAAVVGFGPLGSHTSFRALLPHAEAGQVIQLVRGASAPWAHTHAPSHLISRASKVLARDHSCIAIAAFADPRAGEAGTIYQACNAIYLGTTSTGGAEAFIVHGKRYSARRAYKHFGSTAHAHLLRIDPEASQIPRARKHRYVIPIGPPRTRQRVRRLLEPLEQSYPVRTPLAGSYREILDAAIPLRRG
ncbi:MAG: hypothetical protein AAFR38_12460 [Planctomycetota bacterium]